MNLYKAFKTDSSLETDGIWLEYGKNSKGDPIRIRIARSGGNNTKFAKVMERLVRPHKRAMKLGTLDDDIAQKLMYEAYAEAVVLEWVGVEDEHDQLLPFSKENVMRVFTDLPDLFTDIRQGSEDARLFRENLRSEDLGNSGMSLRTDSSKDQ